MDTAPVFVGIDVSKATLEVAVRPGGSGFALDNDPRGLAELVARLQALAPTLVVLEATGGYEAPALAALQAAGIAVARINPRCARDFARASGRAATTDRIDAGALAHFAEALRPAAQPPEPAERRALEALLGRRAQLVEMRTMESNRLGSCPDAAARASLQRHLDWLDAELAEAERQLAAAVQASPAWRAKDRLLQSIPGIGPAVSRVLLAAVPELGRADGPRLAAWAGLAPQARDSGTLRGRRHIRGGRPEVRRALYLAALSASRHGGPLATFARRLQSRGKAAKVVLVAVARRLLEIANAVVRSGQPWRPELAMTR
jgi:transposase